MGMWYVAIDGAIEYRRYSMADNYREGKLLRFYSGMGMMAVF